MSSPPSSVVPVVTLRSVRVSYAGTEAVDDIDLDVEPGLVTAITGPNGSGKSTLLEVIAGTRMPSSGTRTARSAVAFVPQMASVSERLPVSVRDVVTVGVWGRLGMLGRMDATAGDAVVESLERLGITDLAKHPFASLSGGQRQRTLLAQGVARGAEILLLDEPTTGLDADSSRRIREVMRQEADRGVAVVCVSHDREVIDGADRVVRLEGGRRVEGPNGAAVPIAVGNPARYGEVRSSSQRRERP